MTDIDREWLKILMKSNYGISPPIERNLSEMNISELYELLSLLQIEIESRDETRNIQEYTQEIVNRIFNPE